MKLSKKVEEILSNYNSDNPGTKANLSRILMHGSLGGTGRLLILPVDQGFEHGPIRSFESNPPSYDPEYHIELAIEAGLNAYAAPLGMIEAVAGKYAGSIPLILKLNSSNSLSSNNSQPYQAITSNIKDALRLGCSAVGYTIYPGSDKAHKMINEARKLIFLAKENGLAVVIWSYPRGPSISKHGETAIDICAYAAHIAALIGAHIIKVKPPTESVEQKESKLIYENNNIDLTHMKNRVAHILQASFKSRRIVLFSGGPTKSLDELYEQTKNIYLGGAHGSIIGRNCFQRPKEEALTMLKNLIDIYLGK